MREQPSLAVAPAIAMLAFCGLAALYFGGLVGWSHVIDNSHGPAHYLRLYPLYVIGSVTGTLGSAVVAVLADARLQGRSVSLRQALTVVAGRLPVLLAWSFLAATVGLVLRILEERLPLAGRIAAFFGGILWSLATLLVVPVLILEDEGAIRSGRRSAQLVKERWGEGVTGQFGIGLVLSLISLPFYLLAAFFFLAGTVAGIAALVIVFLVTATINSTLSGVFQTALFRYATGGEPTGAFILGDLAYAVGPRRRRGNSISGGYWSA